MIIISNNNYVGIIDSKELKIKGNFSYINKRLTIFNITSYGENYLSFDNEVIPVENLEGTINGGSKIYFNNMVLRKADFMSFGYIGYPEYVILPTTINEFNSNINTIKFSGGLIDNIYPLKNEIKILKDSKNIELTIDDCREVYSITLYNKKCEIIFDKTKKFKYVDNQPIILKPYLFIKFEDDINIQESIKYYKLILKFLQFILNRKEIKFDEVMLSTKHVVVQNNLEYENRLENNKKKNFNITLYKQSIVNIINIIEKEDTNFSYIPLNNKTFRYLNAQDVLLLSSSFEFEFDKLNIKKEYDDNEEEVINLIESHLETISNELKGTNSKGRKYIKDLKIRLRKDLTLSYKINDQKDKYKELVDDVIKGMNYNYISLYKNLGDIFASLRNKISHGTIKDFSDLEIKSFVVVRAIVYAMILDRAGLDKSSIEEVTKIVFKY